MENSVGLMDTYREHSIGNLNTINNKSLGQIDRYTLLEKLGQGGFGAVYLAEDNEAKIKVAIKTLPGEVCNDADEMDKIRANFALVSRLHHQNIASLLHLHKVDKVVESTSKSLRVMPGDYLVIMEHVEGSTLSNWCKRFPESKVPVETAVEICRQVAEALDFAHKNKIIHRDIKPGNIMIVGSKTDFTIKVIDFGLAAEVRSSMSRVSTEQGNISGTRPYMSPEQFTGKLQTACSDQYSLGVMFYELISGQVPFAGIFETCDTALMRDVVLNESVEPLNELNGIDNKILLKALSKKPKERFENCVDFMSSILSENEVVNDNISASEEDSYFWYFIDSNDVSTQVKKDELMEHISSGNIKRNQLVWTEGMGEWQKAIEIECLQGLFPSFPSLSPPIESMPSSASLPIVEPQSTFEKEGSSPIKNKLSLWQHLTIYLEAFLVSFAFFIVLGVLFVEIIKSDELFVISFLSTPLIFLVYFIKRKKSLEQKSSLLKNRSGIDSDNNINLQDTTTREVSLLLAVGIFLMPYIFSWFTCRKGYTRNARIVSFIWLIFVLSMGFVS